MIASVSGVRGILNQDWTLSDVSRLTESFAVVANSKEFLLARDTRKTGPAISRTVAAAILSRGATAVDYGIISTPALLRESRLRGMPAVMVSASHNDPEYNGLKFVTDGMVIGNEKFEAVMRGLRRPPEQFGKGKMKRVQRTAYVSDLIDMFGKGSFEGMKVGVDLGGGAAISHAPQLLGALGCTVFSINDSYGVFNRRIDPVADDLLVLRKIVRQRSCDIGLGFDCDGDRLVIVDDRGNKRTGDFMLTLAISEMLAETGEKKVTVSMDTTQAIDEVADKVRGEVYRSRIGEANVVALMQEKGSRLGGEGSSGGLIDGAFNYCRDSMLAALIIIRALKAEGSQAYDSVPSFHQERVALQIPRAKAQKAIKALAKKYDDADLTDGIKVKLSKRSWVLIRPSGTEEVVRVSAEAETTTAAAQIAKSFAGKLKELSR